MSTNTIILLLALLVICTGLCQAQPPCSEQQLAQDSLGPTPDTLQVGQWFTAACDGVFQSFTVYRSRFDTQNGDSTLEARLYAGMNWPANADSDPGLGFVTLNVPNGTPAGAALVLDFSSLPSPPTLVQGNTYAIRLTVPVGSRDINLHVGLPGTRYPNGQHLFIGDRVSPGNAVDADMTFEYVIAAPPPAVAQGDPHLVGLRGQHYDFNGRANTVFNLLTSALLQVNSLFTEMEIAQGFFHGTYLQTISIQANNILPAPIVIDAGNSSFVDHPTLRFGVGEESVEFDPFRPNNNNNTNTRQRTNVLLQTDSATVTWEATETTATALGIADNHDDRVIRVATVTITNVAVVEVFCVENGYMMHRNGRLHQNTVTARRNLDVRITWLNNNVQVHGVIGATNDATVARPPGKDEEYEVHDGLLGTDFVHNLYR